MKNSLVNTINAMNKCPLCIFKGALRLHPFLLFPRNVCVRSFMKITIEYLMDQISSKDQSLGFLNSVTVVNPLVQLAMETTHYPWQNGLS